METIEVLGKKSIFVGSGFLQKDDFLVQDFAKRIPNVHKVVILVDHQVYNSGHLNSLSSSLQKFVQSENIFIRVVVGGEQAKSRAEKEAIEDWMVEKGCGKDSCIIAFGGGCVGDLAGFVASTFLRGVPFIQIPTTLLAMVDSSIGGKNGINIKGGKNMLGTIKQPIAIYVDISFLFTLSRRHYLNGMAEVIKAFAIRNSEMFRFLESEQGNLLSFPEKTCEKALLTTIIESIRIKAVIVSGDEFEQTGLRSLLNFGHTIGHAIEACASEWSLLHGECVSIGMVQEAEIAKALGHLSSQSYSRLLCLLQNFSLPTEVPKNIPPSLIMNKMLLDKKNEKSRKKCVLLKDIGQTLEDKATVVDDFWLNFVLSKSITVIPRRNIKGVIKPPGSKSISNRVLLLAAMGKGPCTIRGLLFSEDTQIMLEGLRRLNVAQFEWIHLENGEQALVVQGNGTGKIVPKLTTIYLGNSGTASRFLVTLCTLIDPGSKVVLTGDKRLCERPIKDLVDALVQHQGSKIRYLVQEGYLPIEVQGTGLPGGSIHLAANVSSQFVSSILLSSPFAAQNIVLHLNKDKGVVSQPFIDMTLKMMKQFGIQSQSSSFQHEVSRGVYNNPPSFYVEPDASSAAYPLSMAAITGGEVTVKGIGHDSLQGDANFFSVLEKMGCQAIRSATETTVIGPEYGSLKPIEVDMGDMTDSFMALAAVASFAKGKSKITGIANQRVKECNRIAAMVTEFRKCGIVANELEDGIEIEGTLKDPEHEASIFCYNDHRIAMSFAVVGCVKSKITLLDKNCTSKTYPEFWIDLKNIFGMDLSFPMGTGGTSVKTENTPTCLSGKLTCQISTKKPASVFIIGMRGAGKTHQGKTLAQALGWPFLDLDDECEKVSGLTIKELIAKEGWDKFRDLETKIFHKVVKENSTGHVISCGGGLVMKEENRKQLCNLPLVIHLRRDLNEMFEYLIEKDKSRPALPGASSQPEHPRDTWEKRKLFYDECSGFSFQIPALSSQGASSNWSTIENLFINFVKGILASQYPHVQYPIPSPSFFLSVTSPDVSEIHSNLHLLLLGCHAVELRVDLLKHWDDEFVQSQVISLRSEMVKFAENPLPIIFTVRSTSHGGKFPDDEEKISHLLNLGIKLGCEILDVEATISEKRRKPIISLAKKKNRRVISSIHATSKAGLPKGDIEQMFFDCYNAGEIDVVKVVIKAEKIQDNFLLHDIASSFSSSFKLPVIALCTTAAGKLSRVLNQYLTPVTHPLLPYPAAPGQLSVAEINQSRALLGMIPNSGCLYLFGKPISQSASPTLHNTGLHALSLPYSYHLHETDDIQDVVKKLNESDCLGGSITIPHKQAIVPFLSYTTPEAEEIGSVNTVFKIQENGKSSLGGTNTDWLGLYCNIIQHGRKGKALVIGAGGTSLSACYALKKLGFEIWVYNRSVEKLALLEQKFQIKNPGSWESLISSNLAQELSVIVSTIPLQAQKEIVFPPSIFANKPLVVDVVYLPRKTPILQAAESHGCATEEGVSMLLVQGYHQFQIWTGAPAPRKLISEAVHQKLFGNN